MLHELITKFHATQGQMNESDISDYKKKYEI